MPLLIDGYNLLYATGIVGESTGQGSLHNSRLALLNFLAVSLQPEDVVQTTVVFDAQAAPWGLGRSKVYRGLHIYFAARNQSADELIEEMIAADAAPRQLVVVSSDHEIQRAAKRRRARAVDSDVWYRELLRLRQQLAEADAGAAARPPVPLLAEDVDYWIRQFGGAAALREFLQDELEKTATREELPRKKTKRARSTKTVKAAKRPKTAAPPKPGAGKRRSSDEAAAAKPETAKPRRATKRKPAKKPTVDKPVPPELKNFKNPFPPGYGDDLLGQL